MKKLKFLSAVFLGLYVQMYVCADTPPQFINKLCATHTWFSQIQPGAGNINCTQPSYSDISGTPPAAQWGLITGTLSNQTDLQNALNAKQNTLTLGNLSDAGTDGITVTGGTGAVVGSGTSFSQHIADSTHNGYLGSSDWSLFNGKQASGNYITALTGDVTASGPGSVAATIANNAITTAKVLNGNITNAKIANMPARSVLANLTGSPAAPANNTLMDFVEAGSSIFTISNGTTVVPENASNMSIQANLANGKIYVGSSGGFPVAQTMSGDVTLANTGAATLNVNTVPKGFTGATSFTSGLPLTGNGTGAIGTGGKTGNSTKFVTNTGTNTSGHCTQWDASGNLIDSGAACGGSGVTDVTASGPITSSGGTTPNISITPGDYGQVFTWDGSEWAGSTELFDTSASVYLDLGNRLAYDSTPILSRDDQNRIQYDQNGTESIGYSTARGLYDATGTRTLNWDDGAQNMRLTPSGNLILAGAGYTQVGNYYNYSSLFAEPSGAFGVIDYFAGSGYPNDGYTHTIRVYGYYDTAAGRIYSPSYSEYTVADDGMGGTPYNIDWSFDQITGVSGYRVLIFSDYDGYDFDYYLDLSGDTNTNFIDPDGSIWSFGSTVTPDVIGPNIYVDPSTGFVGINQTAPEKQFTVNGDSYFKGNLIDNNQLLVSKTLTNTSSIPISGSGISLAGSEPYPGSGYLSSVIYNSDTGGASHASEHLYVGSGDAGFHIDHFGPNGYNGMSIDPYWTDFANYGAGFLTLSTNAARRMTIGVNGGVYIGGKQNPLAQLEIIAGTTSFASMLLHSGPLLSTPLAGAVETLSDKLYFTIPTGTARKEITLNDSALTSTRVPFATTNGRLIDDADLTFATDTLSATKVAMSSLTSGRVPFATTAGLLVDDSDMTFATDTLTVTGLSVGTTKIKSYNGITTEGNGVPSIVKAPARTTGATGAVANVATYAVPVASDGSYLVSANVLVTTATLHNFTMTCTYTDEGNTSRTLTLPFSSVAGAVVTAIANAGGAAPYEGVPLHIRAKANTNIVFATTGTFTTVTYNAEAVVQQIK